MTTEISRYLSRLELKESKRHKNLSIFPLCSEADDPADYVLLDEAIEKDMIAVKEVTESGSVPELRLINRSEHKILILDGEELKGAKQNRIVNTTILVGEKKEMIIPVSCVEARRWSYASSDTFSSGKKFTPSHMRRAMTLEIKDSLEAKMGYRSDQSRVWYNIETMMDNMNAASDTAAMSDVFEQKSDQLDDYVKAFSVEPNQVGILASINGEIIACDCFGKHDTLEKLFPKLVKSYAMDALGTRSENAEVSKAEAQGFLDAAGSSTAEAHDSVDLGKNIHLESEKLIGTSLVFEGRVIHLAIFAKEETGGVYSTLRSPRMRRRHLV